MVANNLTEIKRATLFKIMLYNLDNEIDRKRSESRFKALLDKRCIIELKEKKARTNAQNSYLHLILGWFALETGYTLNEAKQIYKELNSDIYFYKSSYREKVKWFNPKVDFIRSSADLDTAEMTKSIEVFRNYSSNEAGVYLPQPDEQRFLNEIEVKMSQQKEYL